MAEEAKETAAAEEATATQTQEKASEERTYTQADLDSIVGKSQANYEAKLARMQKELESVRQRAMTEEEKKLEEAKAEARKEVEAELATTKRQAAVERALLARGVPEERLERVARLVDSEEEPADAVAQLQKDMPELFKSTTPGGGGGRNATSGDPEDWSPDKVSELIRTQGMTAYIARRPEIMKWQEAHGIKSDVRRL